MPVKKMLQRWSKKTKAPEDRNISRASNCNHWIVLLRRRGKIMSRLFSDGVYGGRQQSLTAARAYRDAVIGLFPPFTNYELVRKLKKHNTSGVLGVRRCEVWDGKPAWVAEINFKKEKKFKSFLTSVYGERKAKRLAMEQRKQWLAQLEIDFNDVTETGRNAVVKNFGEALKHPEEILTSKKLAAMQAEGETRLAEINARFDAERPLWLRLRLRARRVARARRIHLHRNELTLSVCKQQGGRAAQRLAHSVMFAPELRTLSEALAIERARAADYVEQIFGANARRAFLKKHADKFDADKFDQKAGLAIIEIIAQE